MSMRCLLHIKIIWGLTRSVWSRCRRPPCSRGWWWEAPRRCTGPLALTSPLLPSTLKPPNKKFNSGPEKKTQSSFLVENKWPKLCAGDGDECDFYRCCRLLHCRGPEDWVCSWPGWTPPPCLWSATSTYITESGLGLGLLENWMIVGIEKLVGFKKEF